jgi:hypothetical protein
VDGRAEVAPPLEQVRPAGTHSLWDFATAALGALCGGLTSPSPLARQGKLGHLLLLRHPGLAQAHEVGGFGEGADGGWWHPISGCPQASKARIAIITR